MQDQMNKTLSEIIKYIEDNFNIVIPNKIKNEKDIISGFSPIDNTKKGTISWSNQPTIDHTNIKSSLIIGTKDLVIEDEINFDLILLSNPRLAFAKILDTFFKINRINTIHKSAEIHQDSLIGKNVHIGPNCSIGKNVSIGDNTILESSVRLENDVSIGINCYVKSNTVIGEDGFGVVRDDNGSLIKIPHLGSVVIGNNVELGSMNTINRGTLKDTLVMNGVKTDDHVHIAHNCIIEQNVVMTPGVTLCGSVCVKERSWLGAQCTILEGVVIEKESMIGIGAVVVKDTVSGSTYIGNPARKLSK